MQFLSHESISYFPKTPIEFDMISSHLNTSVK